MKKQDDRVDEEFGKKSHTKKNVTKWDGSKLLFEIYEITKLSRITPIDN